MPSTIAHSLCGEKALLTCDADQLRKIINRQKWAFIYGCQGPDFLFFYHAFPLYDQKKAGQVHRLGTQVHEQKVNEAFRYMLEWIRKDPHDVLVAYVAGWLSHHALDVQAHPYIYYRTGSPEKHAGEEHRRLEAQIERGLLDYLDLDMKEYLPHKQMKHTTVKLFRIAEMISGLFRDVYDFDLPVKECYVALQQFYSTQKLLADPRGRRYKLIAFLERLFGVPGRGTAMMVPAKYDDALDALNYRHDDWHHPSTGERISTGFMEMYDAAVEESRESLVLLEDFLLNEKDPDKLLEFVGNRSYNSGIADGQLVYFASNWDDEKTI